MSTTKDKSLFPHLKQLFSTETIVRSIGNGKLKVLDFENHIGFGELQSNSLTDRFTRMHRAGNSLQYNPSTTYQIMRHQLYADYEAMDTDPILATALDVLCEEATLKGDKNEVLSIKSSNENIQAELYNLFYEVLNVEQTLPMWIRSLAKYGDTFIQLELAEKFGVYGAKPLAPYDIIREEGQDPNNPSYIRYIYDQLAVAGGYTQSSRNRQIFENYEVAHFRLAYDMNFLPYGRSLLEPGRKLYKQYVLMVDAMLLHRIMRSPEKRIFYVNVGNIPPNEVNQFMQNHINALKKTPFKDQVTGDYNLKFNMQNMMEDFHIPVRPGDTTTRIDTAKGLDYDGIKDVEFLRDQMLAAIKVPKAFLNYSDELNGKSTISSLDLRWSKTVERVQRAVISELKKIACIHLYILGYDEVHEIANFSLSMNNPSIIYEQEKVALMKEKVALHKEMKETKDFSSDWIMEHIWDFSEDEVLEERDLVVYDQVRTFRYNQIENEGNDPSISGESFGTPHDLASIYNRNAKGDVPDGYDEKEEVKLGRPKEKASIYSTDKSAFGRDPLGKKGMNDTKDGERKMKVKPMALEATLANNKDMFSGLSKRFNKKLLIFEQKEVAKTFLDEENLLDDIID